MRTAVRVLSQREVSSALRRSAAGMTLVEILVVIAIIASLAAMIYPAIMDSLKKSQAAMIAQRLDAVQKAEVQYAIDAQAVAFYRCVIAGDAGGVLGRSGSYDICSSIQFREKGNSF